MLRLPCISGCFIIPVPPRKRLKPFRFFLVLLASFLALAFPYLLFAQSPPQPRTIDNVLELMDHSAQSFHSLTAKIEHIKFTAVVSDTSKETGDLYVRKDDKMRIDITAPDQRTILRTGDSLFVYTPKINRVEEYNLGKNRNLVDQYILLGFGTRTSEVRKNYSVVLTGEDELDGKKVVVLELTPKSDEVRKQITKIQMWVDQASWLPLQQKFSEATAGDYFLFHYTDLKENLKKFTENKFKQDWPKNVTRVKP
jgi:outer membrane lipoprotein-sorting protein